MKRQDINKSDVMETGGIGQEELAKFSIDFSAKDIESGLIKICDKELFIECNTGFLITEDGVVLTASHGKQSKFGEFEQYVPKSVPLSNFRHAENMTFISAVTSDGSGRPVEPMRYTADLLMRGNEKSSHTDLAFFKLKNIQSQTELFPLMLKKGFSNLSLIELGKPVRVFVPGFPWPHLAPSVLKNAHSLAQRNPGAINFERISFNFGLVYTTGLIHPAAQHVVALRGDGGSSGALVETNTYSAGPGYSGAPLIDIQGSVLGVAKSGGHSSRFDDLEYNFPASSTVSVSILSMEKNFDISGLNIYFDDRRSMYQSKQNEQRKKKSASLSQRANELESYLKETVEILRKLRRTVTRVKMENQLECFVLVHNDFKVDKDYNINVDEFEIEVQNYKKSRLRYRSENRSQRKHFLQFWKDSGWSPWFDVSTADLLAEMKVKTIVDYEVFGKKLRGFAPFLANPKLIDQNKDFYFRSADLKNISLPGGIFYSAIAGKHPSRVNSVEEKDKWTIQFCNG